MSNKYDLKMIQRGFETLRNVMKAYEYLMEVGAISEVDLYNEYNVKDDAGNEHDFSATIGNGNIEIEFLDGNLCVTSERIVYSVWDEDAGYTIKCIKFEIPNPNEINNDESFFQASTLYDLSDVDGYEWFTTIMNCYAEVMDFMESDDV